MKQHLLTLFILPFILGFTLRNEESSKVIHSADTAYQIYTSSYSCEHAEQIMTQFSALTDLYNNTGGNTGGWTNDANWGNANVPLSQWYGVTINTQGDVTHLHLANNNLNGTLPSSIGSFSSLIELYLYDNSLTGSIPSNISGLTSVEKIRLSNNNLTGSLPTSLGSLSTLKVLTFSNNSISGSFLSSSSSLETIEADNNQLSGTLFNFQSFPALDFLELQHNNISGSIPTSIQSTSATLINLSDNSLTGTIPMEAGLLSVQYGLAIHVSNNNLSGCFPQNFHTNYCNVPEVVINAAGNSNMIEDDFNVFCTNSYTACNSANSPDLKINSVTLPSNTFSAGSSSNFDFVIQNSGTSNAGTFKNKWYLSSDQTPSASELLNTQTVASLNSNSTFYTSNQPISIPANTTAGDYYIILVTDADNQIVESNETNNIHTTLVTITAAGTGLIDLTVMSLNLSSNTVPAGTNITADFTVGNIGTAPADDHYERWYFSSDMIADPSEEIGSSFVSYLAPGGGISYSNQSVSIDSFLSPGTYYFILEVDADNDEYESNENNNTFIEAITVTSSGVVGGGSGGGGLPELNINSMSLSQTTVPAGSTFTLDFEVKNSGTSSAGQFTQRWYLSTDAIPDPSEEIDSYDIYSLPSNTIHFVNNRYITIDPNQTQTTYNIILVIDENDDVDESNESNNILSQQITVTPPVSNGPMLPDYVIIDEVVPDSIGINQDISISGKVSNIGQGDAVVSSELQWGISSQANIASLLHQFTTPSNIPPLGSNSYRNGTFPLPNTLQVGSTYYIYFKADGTDNVQEEDELNNFSFHPFTVVPPVAITGVELSNSVSGPNNNSSYIEGDMIEVNSFVDNYGTVDLPLDFAEQKIYLSTNSTFDPIVDIELESELMPKLTGSNCNFNCDSDKFVNIDVIIPDTIPTGSYYLISYADATGVLNESNEGDNFSSVQINITNTTYKPNLIAQNAVSNSTSYSGGTISTSVEVTNTGLSNSNNSLVKYYLSDDNILDVTDTNIVGTGNTPNLKVGEKAIINKDLVISTSVPAGDYHLIMHVDGNNNIDELFENDNFISKPITITSIANLQVGEVMYPIQGYSGGEIIVESKVGNFGSLYSLPNKQSAYLSTDKYLDPTDIKLSNHLDIPFLNSQAITDMIGCFKIPNSVLAGSYYVIVKADEENIVTELYEDDNYDAGNVQINISQAPDLVPRNPTFPSTINNNLNYNTTFDIVNIGSGTANAGDAKVFISLDSLYDASDTELSLYSVPSLNSNNIETISTTINVPPSLSSGNYKILFIADFGNTETNEIDENNNLVVLETELVSCTDSIVYLTAEVCENEMYSFNGQSYNIAGTYIDSTLQSNGCYLIETLNLSILPISSSSVVLELCEGDSILFNGVYYDTSIIHSDTLLSNNGCDSISTLNLTIHPIYNTASSLSICEGDSILFNGSYLSVGGVYTETFQTISSCDSIVVLDLTILPVVSDTTSASIYEGEQYLWNGNNYNSSGIYSIINTAVNGCDSISILDLTVIPLPDFITFSTTGPNIAEKGSTINIGFTTKNIGSVDADSRITLGFYLSTDTIYDPSDIWRGGRNIAGGLNVQQQAVRSRPIEILSTFQEGSYYIVCRADRLNEHQEILESNNYAFHPLEIVCPLNQNTTTAEICDGESYNWQGVSYSSTGTYSDTLVSSIGCDSTVTLDLTVYPEYSLTSSVDICEGDSVFFGGSYVNSSGTYSDVLTTIDGCDSLVTLDLTVHLEFTSTIIEDICEGDSIFLNNTYYNSSGIYVDTLASEFGCDSIVTLDLTINPSYALIIHDTICENEVYNWEGSTYNNSGLYTTTLTSELGCDSILTLDLAVLSNPSLSIDTILCEGDSILIGGVYYNSAQTISDTISTANGCDSVTNIILSFEQLDQRVQIETVCYGESFVFMNNTYSSSGVYSHYVSNPNNSNCDSLISLDLTVLSQAESSCQNFSSAGTIEFLGELRVAEGTLDPDVLESLSEPTGGMCGNLEYQWQNKIAGETQFQDILGAVNSTLDPGLITDNTCFRRNARVDCQTDWISSNEICFELNVCENFTDGGDIGYNGELISNSNSYDPGIIYESQTPSGGIGLSVEYQWQVKIGNGIWEDINGASGKDYSPNNFTTERCFRRGVKMMCSSSWEYSNDICFEVLDCQNPSTIFNISYSGQTSNNSYMYNPPLMRGKVTNDSNGGEVLYRWQKRSFNNNSDWIDIENTNSDFYNSPAIFQSSCFRYGSRVSCESEWINSPEICIELLGCQNYTDGGAISYNGITAFASQLNPSEISGSEPSGGGGGDAEYLWEQQIDNSGVWEEILGANGINYDPSVLNQTTCLRRKTRVNCQTDWVLSNDICFYDCSDEAQSTSPLIGNDCEIYSMQITYDIQSYINHEYKGSIGISGVDNEKYSFEWSQSSVNKKIENLEMGTYCVTISSINDKTCRIEKCFEISEEVNYDEPILIINEISNGVNSSEFVELLVRGEGDCSAVDLRGFMLDDNNGLFTNEGFENMSGISKGHIRFSDNENYASVPVGALMVIYNPEKLNETNGFTQDPFDSDNDKSYFISIDDSEALIGSIDIPNKQNFHYNLLSDTLTGLSWNSIWLYDYADAIQVRDKKGGYHFGISYGDANVINGGPDNLMVHSSNLIGKAIIFNDGDLYNTNNYSILEDLTKNTPGIANNDLNQYYISSLCEVTSNQQELYNNISFNIFPIPFEDQIYVSTKSSGSHNLSIKIYDLLGKLIKDFEFQTERGEVENKIDFNSKIKSGSYLLTIDNDGEIIFTQKIICIR